MCITYFFITFSLQLWEVNEERRAVQTYIGHKQAVRDINFNNDGTKFLSAGKFHAILLIFSFLTIQI